MQSTIPLSSSIEPLLSDPTSEGLTAGHQGLLIAASVIWLVISCGGIAMLTLYANTPEPTADVLTAWPRETQLELASKGPTLVMFAHPHCPCTRASLGELEKIVARFQDSLTAWVVFYTFANSNPHWHQTDLRSAATAIPGVNVVDDPGGIESQRFHATVSGQTALYSPEGSLLFSGGITLARGHAGDNTGRSAIEALLSGKQPPTHRNAVYGCPISLSNELSRVRTER